MSLHSLEELFHQELKDVYSAEKQIVDALPKMIDAATSEDLKLALTNHLGETQDQVDRLDGVFMAIGKSPEAKKCKGMAGLLDEGKDIMKEDMEPALKDVALISAAQRVKHYEIAAYGTLRTFAEMLGEIQVAAWLQQSLEEEYQADEDLMELVRTTASIEVRR